MMRKYLLIVCLTQLTFSFTYGQVYQGQLELSKVPPPAMHYQEEYTFDTTLNPAAWTTQKKGLNVSFATTDALFFRSEVPLENSALTWEATGWKGERLNAQLLVWSADTLQQIRVLLHDLKDASGRTITKNNFQVNMVRYVVSNYPYGAKNSTCGVSQYKNLYLMPDRFEAFDRFDLPGRTVRPVWIALEIPATTAAGTYTGTLEVKSEKQVSSLNISIRVQDQLLPKPALWKHRLDLWQNPWVVAWENNLTPWSEDHKSLLKKHLKLYADAGGTYITTYAVHSPWADNSYMIEGGMIEWIKQSNGQWKFDYKIFDEYVELAMSVGINEAITVYSPIPWGSRFRYLDAKNGNYVYESWPPESQAFRDNWNVFLTDLQKHLEHKGWFEKTYLGINENEMSQTLAAISMVKKHSAKWKITYAGDWHKELDSLLDDYCFVYGKEADVDAVKKRAAKGFTTTWYVCCTPPVPNNFVFSPPVEGRWQGWYSAAHGYSGFLRWAYDAWPADPKRDSRHPFWPSGDCYLIYPGANSCIRFEKLREGIVDYEKIRILKAKAAASTDKNVQSLLVQLQQHLQTFLAEKDFDTKKITADVAKGKLLVEQLSNALSKK